MTLVRSRSLLLALTVVAAACASGANSSATVATVATVAAASPAAARGPSPEEVASIARGDSLFNAGACQRCHGQKGVGAPNGPNLITGQWLHADGSQAQIAAIITNGIAREAVKDSTRRFPMRPRGGPMNLTDVQVQDLANYVVSISRGKSAR